MVSAGSGPTVVNATPAAAICAESNSTTSATTGCLASLGLSAVPQATVATAIVASTSVLYVRMSVARIQNSGERARLDGQRSGEFKPRGGGGAQHIEILELGRHGGAPQDQHVRYADFAFRQRALGERDILRGGAQHLCRKATFRSRCSAKPRAGCEDIGNDRPLGGGQVGCCRRPFSLGKTDVRLFAPEQRYGDADLHTLQAVGPGLSAAEGGRHDARHAREFGGAYRAVRRAPNPTAKPILECSATRRAPAPSPTAARAVGRAPPSRQPLQRAHVR